MSARKDEIDRAIEEALSAAVSGEPLRVDATSVRRGLLESRGSTLPVWLAVAAVLIVGIGVTFRERKEVAEPPAIASRNPSGAAPQNAVSPSPAAGTSLVSGNTARPLATNPPPRSPQRRIAEGRFEKGGEELYEGLPRLSIASLDAPEALRPEALGAEVLVIPAIEIAPLSVSSLSNEQEH